MWNTLNFKGRSKAKKRVGDICNRTQDVECERDWSGGLGATLSNIQKLKTIFIDSGIFPMKSR